jgi:hypothetical protein
MRRRGRQNKAVLWRADRQCSDLSIPDSCRMRLDCQVDGSAAFRKCLAKRLTVVRYLVGVARFSSVCAALARLASITYSQLASLGRIKPLRPHMLPDKLRTSLSRSKNCPGLHQLDTSTHDESDGSLTRTVSIRLTGGLYLMIPGSSIEEIKPRMSPSVRLQPI